MLDRKAMMLSGAAAAAVMMSWAPSAAAADASAKASTQLDEVIVTATHREANLQQVPVAVTAINAEQLEKAQAVTLRDLAFSVPSLVFAGQSTNRRPDITLRGISSATRAPGYEGSIGFFIDGVAMPFPAQWNNPVLDAERVEVLYGPQDTLFGKDTISGAISITTKKPTFDFHADANAEYGNYNYMMGRGAVNMPLADNLAVRLSAFLSQRDGYVTNIHNGQKYQDSQQAGGRVQVRYAPDDRLNINASLSIYNEIGAEVQAQTIGGTFSTGDPRKVNLNIAPKTSRNLYDSSITADYAMDGGAKLSSITAYSKMRAWYRQDEDGNPLDLWFTNIADHSSDFSQELRFTSAVGKAFDFVGGLYYGHTFWGQAGTLETLPGDPKNDPGGIGTVPTGSRDYSNANARKVDGDTYAVYGEVRYHLTEQLTVHGGLRYAYDTKNLEFAGQKTIGAGFLNQCIVNRAAGKPCATFTDPVTGAVSLGSYPAIPATTDSMANGAVTGSAGVDYQITPDAMVYAKVSTGQKGGGWNTGTQKTAIPEFGPEKVTSYEAGEKVELFDHHLRLNADIFYEDYKNKQETIFISITDGFKIVNAAAAKIKGFEATANLKLGELLFDGGIGYADATYKNFACTATLNCAGQQLVFAPKKTASGAVEWDHQLGELGQFSLRGEATYRSRLFLGVPNALNTSAPPVTLFNARAALDLSDKKTELYVFAKNLANKTYLISQVPGDPGGRGGTSAVLYGQPRFVGVGIRHDF